MYTRASAVAYYRPAGFPVSLPREASARISLYSASRCQLVSRCRTLETTTLRQSIHTHTQITMRYFAAVLAQAALAVCIMADDAPLKAVADSTSQFSTNFFKTIASQNKGKNIISSPLSAHLVLSMASYGAGGNTAVQMRQSLQLPSDDNVARTGFQNIMDQLNGTPNVTLELANKVFVAKDMQLNSDYKKLTSDSFRSEAEDMDVSKPEEVAAQVNHWTDEKTHHKISKILESSDVTPDSRMFLLNAVYFKGDWKTKFERDWTENKAFHVDEKTVKDVPTMSVTAEFVFGELPDLKARFIELPYKNEDLKMIIIVPDEINGLAAIEENLEAFNQTRLSQSGFKREVILNLPKFKVETSLDLEQPLKDLGMTDMFTDAANFSGIAKEPLKVSKVIQKAFIEVNEEGSEAAAVTEIRVGGYSAVKWNLKLNVDRPFYYKIHDQRNNAVLFAGHICSLDSSQS